MGSAKPVEPAPGEKTRLTERVRGLFNMGGETDMENRFLFRLTALAVAMAMVVLGAGAALADTLIVNDLVTGGNSSLTPGSSGSAKLWLEVSNGTPSTDQSGCNVTGDAPGTVTLTSSNTAVVNIASPPSAQVVDCGVAFAVTIGYTVSSAATQGQSAVLSATITGGKANTSTKTYSYDTTDSFTVTVAAPSCAAASVATHPVAQSVTYGSDVTFTATGAGSPAPTVQWQSGSAASAAWADVPGATSTSLTLTKPAVAQSGTDYRAVFTNTCNGTKTAATSPASLTVARRPITVTADPQTKTYGDADPALTSSITSGSLVTGDSLSGTLSRVLGSNVGTYAIEQGTLTAGSNYDLTFAGANLTINKAQLSVNAVDKSKTYGGTNPTLTSTYSGFVNGDTAATTTISGDADCSLASDAGPNAGIYTDAITCAPGTLSSTNYSFITGSKGTFTINKAPTTTTITCDSGPFYFSGSAFTPCSASVTGAGGLSESVAVTYSNNVSVGSATANASFAGGANHLPSSATPTSFTISAWTLRGFHRPIDGSGIYNSVKGGHTVPLKFNVLAGSTELTETSAVRSFGVEKANCVSGAAIDAVEELATTGGTSLRYDTAGGQFVQNWKTPTSAGTCYKATMTTQDGSSISALFKITK